jgi:GDP-L-fucose synthase
MLKILITGSQGMLGKSLINFIDPVKYKIFGVDLPIDLRDRNKTKEVFNYICPDYVIHTAAKVGGVKANSENLNEFYRDNVLINMNVLDCSHETGVKKVISLLSTCVYPDKVNYPLTEEQIHNGQPHKSNYAYAYAKRMLDIQSQIYREQYGCNFISLIPNNLFGPEDNFDLNNSHVIPSIIRKIYEAKYFKNDVELWGDGKQLREFTFVDDLAKILLLVLENYNELHSLNVGNTNEISILEISEKICKMLNFSGNIKWNNKDKGQEKKPSSNEKFLMFLKQNNINFKYTKFDEALEKTCNWFEKNYPNIRGF